MTDGPASGSYSWALCAARAASDKKALDIVTLDIKALIAITDYFVIVTGMNARHADAICDAVEEALRKEYGIKPIGREGMAEKTWALLDYGDIVVHVFQPDHRAFYRLDTMWNDAAHIDLEGLGIVAGAAATAT
jgi:ribosome-associated protein